MSTLDLYNFDQSELNRTERLRRGLAPIGELDVSINHAEYLTGTGDSAGKRLLEEALEKKRSYLAGVPRPEYRPSTQTKTKSRET